MSTPNKYAKVEGQPSLVRDLHSRAVLNSSQSEFSHFVKLRDQKRIQENKINTLEQEVAELKRLVTTLLLCENKCNLD